MEVAVGCGGESGGDLCHQGSSGCKFKNIVLEVVCGVRQKPIRRVKDVYRHILHQRHRATGVGEGKCRCWRNGTWKK